MEILNQLACPICHYFLKLSIHKKTKERVLGGKLHCEKCKETFTIKDGIVCFFSSCRKPTEKTARNLRKTTLNQEIPRKWMRLFSRQELIALKKEWQWMLSSLKKSKDSIHLDFATGTGRFLRNIVSATKGEIVALEYDYPTCVELQYFLKKIRKYGRVSIICADARNMPFKNEVFDSISSWHGLDEPKMDRALKEVKRVLKPKGCFVASGVHYLEGSKSFLRAKKHNINFLTKEIIVKALKKVILRGLSLYKLAQILLDNY
jgi:ubiquinone/menaquinone biosynthesis C-methylase UbiE